MGTGSGDSDNVNSNKEGVLSGIFLLAVIVAMMLMGLLDIWF